MYSASGIQNMDFYCYHYYHKQAAMSCNRLYLQVSKCLVDAPSHAAALIPAIFQDFSEYWFKRHSSKRGTITDLELIIHKFGSSQRTYEHTTNWTLLLKCSEHKCHQSTSWSWFHIYILEQSKSIPERIQGYTTPWGATDGVWCVRCPLNAPGPEQTTV